LVCAIYIIAKGKSEEEKERKKRFFIASSKIRIWVGHAYGAYQRPVIAEISSSVLSGS